jgi:uncharacterized protein (TIGR00255 family)
MTLASMTGFARCEGSTEALAWAWELRAVNGRGLDLRFRLPPGWDFIEPSLRELAARSLRRGNVSASLNLKRGNEARITFDPAMLDQVLAIALELRTRIPDARPPNPEALLALPGVLRQANTETEAIQAETAEAVRASFTEALAALVAARREEGARLAGILATLLDEIAALHRIAVVQAADQPALHRQRLLDTLAGLLTEQAGVPQERIAQEVALLAARSDVREELDRLASHIEAARALLAEPEAIGRRFDFLVQEFNREANTLCSKSASAALTATGLELKAAIERLREQVQNVE